MRCISANSVNINFLFVENFADVRMNCHKSANDYLQLVESIA